ncbi:hypothetical protein P691DRAFT_802805 [Macrolepiota fuliginosa MF-IS2]|uniref:Geranylgeranyl pyrophosphate synthetase n=1 Tax=Macrolepiota fuliginosa MF-IS2 TaxID=1400762 RepID=A0A9P5XM15_9AGAR|nr:hypothetical protein P691DRAFT_802805 [Macrolepiota fuliginosa MF-IS2]
MPPPVKRPLSHELAPEPLLTIEVPEAGTSSEELQIKDYRYIGSYNWAEGSDQSNPVIVVPGSPPEWLENPLPITVPGDTGAHYRDRNGHMLPGRPLLALVTAVNELNVQPAVEWKAADFVTDRNSLRKLLRWVRRTGRDWRIDTELVGNKTIFLNRWEQKTVDHLHGNMYGFGFENAVTKTVPGGDGVPGHARIATYDYAGLKMIMQFEVDAYLPTPKESSTPPAETADTLAEAISTINLAEDEVGRSFGLGIIRKGNSNIPNSAIIELATTTRQVDWKERYPQIFFSQTPNHFLARHDQLQMGTFTRIDKRAIDCPVLQAANSRLQPAFKKLRAALEAIQRIVMEHGHGERLTLLYTNKRLEVYKRLDDKSCLPDEALALFNTQ